jgi:hypothetical protein
VQVGGEVASMLVFAGFLFVGLKTKAGAGQVKAWNMATNQEYTLEGHVVRGAACWLALQTGVCDSQHAPEFRLQHVPMIVSHAVSHAAWVGCVLRGLRLSGS